MRYIAEQACGFQCVAMHQGLLRPVAESLSTSLRGGKLTCEVIGGARRWRQGRSHVDRPCPRRRRRHSSRAHRASVRAGNAATPLRRRAVRYDPAGYAAHRALLLALVGLLCFWVTWAPPVRPVALLAAAINIFGFLGFYALYGNPAGALRTIAIGDLVALPPLAFAAWTTLWK